MGRLNFGTKLAQILVIFVFCIQSANAQESMKLSLSQVTVSGEGVITAMPDMATVHFSVVSRHKNPDIARTDNEKASAAALNAIRALGVEEKDIQLQNLQLNQIREYNNERQIYIDRGYEATRSLVVTVRNLDKLPDLVAALISNGANRMDSIQYGLDDRDAVELEVLRLAVARAKKKASTIVDELGLELGTVLQLQEQGVFIPSPVYHMEAGDMAGMASKSGGDPAAYASGQIEVRASVTVVFSIK